MRHMLLPILATALTCGSVEATAFGSEVLQGVMSRIEKQHQGCNVNAEYTGQIATSNSDSSLRYDSALVVMYVVDGCQGGNNWSAFAQVYGIKGAKSTALLRNPLVWLTVKGADFNSKRALIYAVDQGPDDVHCCPTDGKTIEIAIRQDEPIVRNIRAWKAKN